MKRILVAVLILLVAGAGYFTWTRYQSGGGRVLDIQTAALQRGDVRRVIATSGSVKARVTVDVSTQLSGQISELGADFNAKVAQGDLLARIDPATFEARIRQLEAGIAVAEAGVALATASVEKATINLAKANRELERANTLAATGATTQAAVDSADAAHKVANADVSIAMAQSDNANAVVRQRIAELDGARIDLDRTYIRSPIDGVVIDRVIEVGQTVSASSSAPKLFTLAEDLANIEIGAQVDEADIGQVAAGNPVTFTVDAFPDASFSGVVAQVRLAPTSEQNVVTYTVVIRADNPRRRLLPGMTANVEIVTGERRGVLTVLNEALRFQPRGAAAELARSAPSPVAGAPEANRAGGPAAPARAGGAGRDLIAGLQQELNLDEPTVTRIRAALRDQLASLRPPGQPGRRQRPGGAAARRPAPGGGGLGAGGLIVAGPVGVAPDEEAGDVGAAIGGAQNAANDFRQQLRTRTERVLRENLSPDQFAKYLELQSNRRAAPRFGTVWTREPDGTLEQHRVEFGLADINHTEIVGNDLPEGSEIVLRVRETTR